MMPVSLAAMLLTAGTVAVPAYPPHAATLAAGDRIRVTPGPRSLRLTATVLEVQPDALVVRTSADGAPTRIALSGLSRLEVARGRRRWFGTGFRIGFVPGALFGAIAGSSANCGDGATSCEASVGLAVVGAAICGTASGLLGGLIGAAVRTDRWVPVPADPGRAPRVSLGLIPARAGIGARFTVAF